MRKRASQLALWRDLCCTYFSNPSKSPIPTLSLRVCIVKKGGIGITTLNETGFILSCLCEQTIDWEDCHFPTMVSSHFNVSIRAEAGYYLGALAS